MNELNEEQKKDIADRIGMFKSDLEALRLRHQVDIGYAPQFMPLQPGLFGAVVASDYIDLKYRNPSPFQAGKK